MPKIVDHDERREEILQAAIRVIDSVGLDNTTTRAIALESGYSNGVLSHYFQDKDDILQSILMILRQLAATASEEAKAPMVRMSRPCRSRMKRASL